MDLPAVNGAPELPAVFGKAAELEQKYIQLLEKRIAELEAVIGKTKVMAGEEPKTNGSTKAEENGEKKSESKGEDGVKDGEKDGKKESEEEKKEEGEEPRYRNVVKRYNSEKYEWEDIEVKTVQAEPVKKKDVKVCKLAFTFRKVYEEESGTFDYSEVDIEAPGLRKLLKNTISHYPGDIWDSDSVNMRAPFAPLVYHWDTLVGLSGDPKAGEQEETDETRQTSNDLRRLLDHVAVSSELQSYFKTRTTNAMSKTTTYDTMWTLFAPGTQVYAKIFMDQDQVFETQSAPPTTIPDEPPYGSSTKVKWSITAYAIDWNGSSFEKKSFEFSIEKFQGTKAINALEVYPVEYHDNCEELRKKLIRRGQSFQRICERKKGAEKMYQYKGKVLSTGTGLTRGVGDQDDDARSYRSDDDIPITPKTTDVDGKIIVDFDAYIKFGPGTLLMGEVEPTVLVSPCTCSSCRKSSIRRWSPTIIGPRDRPEAIDQDNTRILCPPRVLGYVPQKKMWAQFQVDLVHDVPDDDDTKAFDEKLILAKEKKKLIKTLVQNHGLSKKNKADEKVQVEDIVEGKGRGLVILLHGPPGVGKTLTAESVAMATGKPLFSVSVADIGLDPKRVERNLNNLFALATAWEAVLLIDEADVFMEQRTEMDMTRNALVSVLLRVLEYYEGILILTTNRILAFDVAVQSRVHLAVLFEDLNKEEMKDVFNVFLKQLNDKNTRNKKAIEAWAETAFRREKLNGRQIRNLISSAQALARGDNNRKLELDDIKDVYDFTLDFQQQLDQHTRDRRGTLEAKAIK